MKTLSKVLSMLLVIVMCVSLFGANAYASGLAPIGSDSQGGLAPLDSDSQGGLAPVAPIDESGSDNIDDEYSNSQLAPIGAIGNVTAQSDEEEIGKLKSIDESGIMPFSGTNIVAKIQNTGYETLEAAIEAANKSGKGPIVLRQNYELNTQCEINRNVTIDLNGNTLTIGNGALLVAANVTLKNGTVSHDNGAIANVLSNGKLSIYDIIGGEPTFDGSGKVAIYSGTFTSDPGKDYLASGYVYDPNSGKVGSKTETYVAILKSSGKGYADAAKAFEDAKANDTITFPEKDDSANIVIDSLVNVNGTSLTLNLGTNYIEFSDGVQVNNNANLIVNGNGFSGDLTLNTNARLTLSCSYADSTITTTKGNTVTVNGTEVRGTGIVLANSTLNMKSGTISNIEVSAPSTLNVSGGYVNGLTNSTDSAIRAISGGEWTNVADLTFFDASIKDGMKRNEADDATTFTVGKGAGSGAVSPTPSQAPGVTSGKFTMYNATKNNPYVKGSGVEVYFTESTGNQLYDLWIGTKYLDTNNVTNITAYMDSYYSPVGIDNDFLDSLNAGTYYLYTRYADDPELQTKYVGQLVIRNSIGGGTNIPDYDGTLQVTTRYENEWYQGDDPLQFYVDKFPGSGKDWTNMKVYIDGREIGNLDYYDYHNGYFYISTAKLTSLGSGTHWLTVEDIRTGETGSCSFYIGPTLKARDTSKHVTGSGQNLVFVCSEPISRARVGTEYLDNYGDYDYYKLSRDGKTITLTARFLNERVAGRTYTLTVTTESGEDVSTTFQILTKAQASSSPKTGDNSNLALWVSALVMSGAAAAVILPKMKKKEIEG